MVFGRTKLERGQAAERHVDRAARQRGWRRVAQNYHARGGELDLVYRQADTLVVVEVRYRARSDYGSAAATVTRTKQRRIVSATRQLLADNPRWARLAIRFDVVGVDGEDNLDWIENAFYAE
ncbi:YraN family protein [Salinisphaera sp. Q1T1-3]|uniref:YraN family protein n=1 Tax=Salinisphaera sp. Q1T1-3 TaxID=2321229 RepID=UPI000E762EB1|nr:YraN family protein [Salinisphaera sp. Q1T1-3]RJS92235.1 YraN family protein [Salinisphaera sp. Q1T1-3]